MRDYAEVGTDYVKEEDGELAPAYLHACVHVFTINTCMAGRRTSFSVRERSTQRTAGREHVERRCSDLVAGIMVV
jgi:hypothetical protein